MEEEGEGSRWGYKSISVTKQSTKEEAREEVG